MIKLDKRLKTLYDMVRNNTRVVDVGADHGYLIIKLIIDKKIAHGYCTDISEKCLKKARDLAKEYKISKNITFHLSDGLNDILESNVDDIIIAGMGADLISRILTNTLWLKKSNNKHLILQPMFKPWIVRNYLFKNGFKILSEAAILVKNHFYVAILSEYSGNNYDFDNIDIFIGALLNNPNQTSIDYLLFLSNKFNSIAQNILTHHSNPKLASFYKSTADQILKKLSPFI